MTIKFITATENPDELTFEMVEENQFFVSFDGGLYQKKSYKSANQIAMSTGTPYSRCVDCSLVDPVCRILAKVEKIEF